MSQIEQNNPEKLQVNNGRISNLYSKTIDNNNLQSVLNFEMQKKFQDFGLTKQESKIYMFLSKNGPKIAREISSEENIPRTETYHIISNLKNKGVIASSHQIKPQQFSALPIDKVLELLIEKQKMKIEELKFLKDDMVYMWNSFQGIMHIRKFGFKSFKSIN